jgi:hypothetical protein
MLVCGVVFYCSLSPHAVYTVCSPDVSLWKDLALPFTSGRRSSPIHKHREMDMYDDAHFVDETDKHLGFVLAFPI